MQRISKVSPGAVVDIDPHETLIRKLREHSRLSSEDVAEIRALRFAPRELSANEDVVRHGDRPNVSVLVTSGVVARYHLLPSGRRQYLAFHLAGDMPDSQAIFVDQMDHSVCAIGPAKVEADLDLNDAPTHFKPLSIHESIVSPTSTSLNSAADQRVVKTIDLHGEKSECRHPPDLLFGVSRIPFKMHHNDKSARPLKIQTFATN